MKTLSIVSIVSIVVDISVSRVNPYAAELFVSFFHSFEAGIANANSSFK